MNEPVRVLHVLGGLTLGGAESRVMDLYRNINREKMQFDFLIHTEEEQHFEKEVVNLGGNVYRIPRFKMYNYFSYRKAIKQFFASHHEFRAVHGHMTSTASIYLPIAKKSGVPITIAHARSAGVDKGLKGYLTKLLRRDLKYKADYCLSCSKEAGIAVYGQDWINKGKVEVIPNAIDARKYSFDGSVRLKLRKELGLDDKLVIGHVGSFRTAKNHFFMIQIFEKIKEKRKDAVLLLVGEGILMNQVKEQVNKAGLQESVIFTGNKADVSPYYQVMDYLLFPSLYEGLPGTIMEAQTAGLKCLVSDTVTPEVKISDLVNFYSLNRTANEWAEYILQNISYERVNHYDDVYAAGFDIQAQIYRYNEIYKKNVLLMVPLLHQGGFEKICVMTARLLQDNYHVKIAIFSKKNMFYDVEGLQLFNLEIGSKRGKINKVINVIKRRKAIRKIKKQENIHITYSFGPTANLVNALAKVNDKVWIGIRGFGALDDVRAMKLTCKRADKVICCAKEMADEVIRLYSPKEVVCLYNPCDTEKIRSMALLNQDVEKVHMDFFEDHKRIIASMSREDDVKGFWHLLKAFALIKEKMTDVGLVIIGEGEFTEYKKLAEDLHVADSVLFTGVQKNPFCYLTKASVYVMTSITEGFPNSLIEAMALGVPAMSVNCKTGPAEIFFKDYKRASNSHAVYIGEYGVLLPILNPKKNLDASVFEEEEQIMAVEILNLLQNLPLLNTLKKEGKLRSEYYSMSKYVSQLDMWIMENE